MICNIANCICMYRYYYVTLNLGNPPKPYALDIDTGIHLTWLLCDAPCRQWLPVILLLVSQ